MNNQAVDQYLIAINKKYQVSNKLEKGQLLDHAELITGRSRKQLIRRLQNIDDEGELKPALRSGRLEDTSVLSTFSANNPLLQKRCIETGVAILPKELLGEFHDGMADVW